MWHRPLSYPAEPLPRAPPDSPASKTPKVRPIVTDSPVPARSPAHIGTATAASKAPVVSIRNLEVSFSTDAGAIKAVDGVSLSVAAGEVLAIVGESGSGKTVTAKTILGLLPETATARGAIVLSNRAGTDSNDVLTLTKKQLRGIRGSDVSMVFQEPSTALNPVYTVGWQIMEGLRAHSKISRSAAKAKAIDILRKVGIPDPETRVNYYPHQFSGGQKQRVVIAQALVLDPGLIVADEPTTALDVTVQAEILDLLRRCRDEFGTAIVLITHNMGVVADLADRVAVMYEGKVVEEADAVTLFSNPQNDYTKKLLASVPHIGQGALQTAERASGREQSWQSTAPVVVATDLRIEYPGRLGRGGFVAVDGVSFEIRAGEVLGLVGESGSGKTTIGRAIGGLTRVTGGSLKVLDHEMNGVRERVFKKTRSNIGFVFQDPASSFNPLLTIAECVAEPLVIHGRARDPRAARTRVDELLEAVQLPKSYGDRYPHELSGGQRQRASLARAIALEPALLIADEPTSALDVSVQARVLELFAELQREFGFAALFISHDLAVVDLLADRIAVLFKGKLVEEGTGAEVLGDPKHPYTQRLLASLPVPDPIEQAKRRDALRLLRAAGQ
ncbi:ABC transporter ATP-binding protein [Subtercola vilae]|uniref:ABC transporter ATP-binding protein n=1 Tax=Subtercola vilae TaxID=2056433 RepID=A0A4T2BWK0_9MICO|nr:ABC transporter ATP-binding protein [Subtercola vilae]